MKFNCSLLKTYEFDINDWVNEYNKLYKIYKKEYVNAGLKFKEIPIKFKRNPKIKEKDNSFYHMTTGHDEPVSSDEERVPDTKRIRFFYYPKIMINNYNCALGCPNCSGMKVWFQKERKITKAYIYFDEIKYVVILEYRQTEEGFEFFLFKTAYYVNYERPRKLFLLNYQANINTPLK